MTQSQVIRTLAGGSVLLFLLTGCQNKPPPLLPSFGSASTPDPQLLSDLTAFRAAEQALFQVLASPTCSASAFAPAFRSASDALGAAQKRALADGKTQTVGALQSTSDQLAQVRQAETADPACLPGTYAKDQETLLEGNLDRLIQREQPAS